jgi:hypothetical protein
LGARRSSAILLPGYKSPDFKSATMGDQESMTKSGEILNETQSGYGSAEYSGFSFCGPIS